MNNFYVLSSDNINALNGGARFVKLLSEKTSYWEKKNIKIICKSNSGFFEVEEVYRNSIEFKIKKKIKNMIKKSRFGVRSRFFLYDLNIRGTLPVKNIGNISEHEWILLNDLFVADRFFKIKGNRFKTIFLMHNGGNLLSMFEDYKNDPVTWKYLQRSEKNIYQKSVKIVFVSERARELFCERYPEYKDKTICIYIGIEAYESPTNQNRSFEQIKLITVGSVCKRKNQLSLIKALEKVNNPSITLKIVGGGDMLTACKKYVNEKKLESRVFFTGPQSDVYAHLEEANVFISVSLDEGLPVSAQEAMQSGLPLIMTDVGGCRDLIDNNGLLIGTSVEEIVNAIKDIERNKDELTKWGKRSKDLFNTRFLSERMLDNYYDLIRHGI